MLSNVHNIIMHVYLHTVALLLSRVIFFSFLHAGWCMSLLYSAAPVWAGRKSRESSNWQKHYVMHEYYV